MPEIQSEIDQFLPPQVARLAGAHYLTTAQILTETTQLDLVTAVVFVAITRFNVEEILRDPVKAALYAATSQPPPESARVPVSAYALAREMAIPYETVRRHTTKLVKLDFCARVDGGGFVVTDGLMGSAIVTRLVDRIFDSVLDYVRTLGSYGVSIAASAPRPADNRMHVARLNARHFLGLTRSLATNLGLELFSGLVMMAMLTANTQTFRDAERMTVKLGEMQIIPQDAARQPISVYALAKSLSMPYETARRHVGGLIERGFCVRVEGGGVLVPASVQLLPGFMGFVHANSRATKELLSALATVGISARPYEA